MAEVCLDHHLVSHRWSPRATGPDTASKTVNTSLRTGGTGIEAMYGGSCRVYDIRDDGRRHPEGRGQDRGVHVYFESARVDYVKVPDVANFQGDG